MGLRDPEPEDWFEQAKEDFINESFNIKVNHKDYIGKLVEISRERLVFEVPSVPTRAILTLSPYVQWLDYYAELQAELVGDFSFDHRSSKKNQKFSIHNYIIEISHEGAWESYVSYDHVYKEAPLPKTELIRELSLIDFYFKYPNSHRLYLAMDESSICMIDSSNNNIRHLDNIVFNESFQPIYLDMHGLSSQEDLEFPSAEILNAFENNHKLTLCRKLF